MSRRSVFARCATTVLLALGLSVSLAEARVVRFVVEDRQPYAGGEQFGNSGSFERLIGTAYMEVDPADPLNAIIVNLDKAPKNARGMVEFSAPFWIIKPVDMARGNRKIWYAINNRGNSELVPRANAAAVSATVALRLELGFSLVDAGWHGDGIPNPNQLFPTFPIATQPDGSPIVGPLRLEHLPTVDQFTRRLIVTPWKPYEAADTDTTHSSLTVRDRQDAPKTRIASDRWAFGVCPTGQASLVLTTTDLCLFDGFQANKMYELIYPAKDPIVMGLAHAVTRDVGSFLRYQTHDDLGNPNPLAASAAEVGIRRAYSSGVSSTGMYEREWIYLGFNEDEQHRKVFDGVTIYTAGAHRLFANVQFAHPTFYSRQDANQDYTSNAYPPFTFAVITDPISGNIDGILKRPATDPLVMQIDGGLEMWQWKASLNVVDGLGRPVPIPDNARLYLLEGSTHVGIGQGVLSAQLDAGPPGVCQYGTQRGSPFNATHRALVVAMDEWADQGIPAPKSNFPGLGKLVTLAEYRAIFPMIPGVQPTILMNELNFLFFGPNFDSTGGLEEVLPPEKLDSYRIFQTRIDNDGNPIAGVGQMEVRVPLGTNMGWNVRVAPRAPDLCGLTGSYAPFATTRAERLANGDSRLSLEERYKSHAGFVMAVEKAAKHLVKERFMLPQDAQSYIEAAQASQVLGGAGN
jgi:hypothetical protein